MTKFELKRGLWTLSFNGVEYEEGQIFDLPEKDLKGIEEHIVKIADKPKEDEELPQTEPVNFDELPPTFTPPLPPVVEEPKEEEKVETNEEKVEDLDLSPVEEDKIEGEEEKVEEETPKTDESSEEVKNEEEGEDELVLDFPTLEKMTRENLFKFVKEDLKNAWVEVPGLKFNSTKQEIIDALKAL